MRSFFLATLLLCCCFYQQSVAQDAVPFTMNQGQSSTTGYYETLPFDIVGRKIVITITINGKNRRFVLDTGAPLMISAALAEELKPKVLQQIPVRDAFGKEDSMKVVAVEGLALGNTVFDQVPALINAGNDLLIECLNVDGIIGSNLLRNSILQLDMQRKVIVLTDREDRFAFRKKEGVALIKTQEQSNPYIYIELPSKVSVEVLFDTGDNDFLSISNKHYKYIQGKKEKALLVLAKGFGSSSYGMHGKEDNTQKLRLQVDKVGIARTSFTNVISETMDNPNSRMGMKLMEYGLVTIDYKNSRFYFTPYQEQKEINLKEKKWQIDPNVEGNKIVVGIAWGAAADKVKHGEEIVAIDGRPTAPVDICRLVRERILPAEQESITLTVKGTDGTERVVETRKE